MESEKTYKLRPRLFVLLVTGGWRIRIWTRLYEMILLTELRESVGAPYLESWKV